MAFVPVGGTRIYYEETGSPGGRPLLLLHASLQTAESMAPVRRLLAHLALRVVTVDQRGHGRSANPGGGFTLKRLADDMEELTQRLALTRPIVIGYSLGGTVGIELARRGLASGLVVLASRALPPGPGRREAFDPENIRQRSPQWARDLAQKHVETPWEDLANQIGELFEGWPGFGAEALASISCPVLVVQGDRDLMVPLADGEEIASRVSGARLVVAPRAGHPELLYRADAMKAVQEFVTGLVEG